MRSLRLAATVLTLGLAPVLHAQEAPSPGGPPPVRPAELWDLVSAFARLMRETLAQFLLRQTFDRPHDDLASGRSEFANKLCHFKSRFRLSSLSLIGAFVGLNRID